MTFLVTLEVWARGAVGDKLRQGLTALPNQVPLCSVAMVHQLPMEYASRIYRDPARAYAAQYMGTSGTETERIAAETEKRVAATYEATKSRKEEVVSMLISFVTNVDTTVRTTGQK